MIRWIFLLLLIAGLSLPVSAESFSAPPVPDSGAKMMPSNTHSFAEGLWELARKGCEKIRPDLAEAAKICTGVIAAAVLVSLLQAFSGCSKDAVMLAGTVIVSIQLLSSANSMLRLGCATVESLSSYGKLLLPVMTAALAAQGGVTASTALYVGTTFFDTLLGSLIHSILTPMVLVFLAIGIAAHAIGDDTLKKWMDSIKAVMSWSLKTLLMGYTAYMGITGVVSGSTDAAALKAARLTISTVVPVVGGILSDASEAVLVSVGTMKNAAGIYGILAFSAILLEPFLKIGVHYLMLKGTGMICSVMDSKGIGGLVEVFSSAFGIILAMTGSCCLLLLISTVCFIKGIV